MVSQFNPLFFVRLSSLNHLLAVLAIALMHELSTSVFNCFAYLLDIMDNHDHVRSDKSRRRKADQKWKNSILNDGDID